MNSSKVIPTHESGRQSLASRQCALMSHALRSGEVHPTDYIGLVVALSADYAVRYGKSLLKEMNGNGNLEIQNLPNKETKKLKGSSKARR